MIKSRFIDLHSLLVRKISLSGWKAATAKREKVFDTRQIQLVPSNELGFRFRTTKFWYQTYKMAS